MSAQPQPPALKSVTVRNPASGEIIGQYQEQTADAVRTAIRQARVRQPAWAGTSLLERQRCIHRMRNILLAQADDVAQVIADCVGKTRVEALATEVMPGVIGSRWYEKHAAQFLQSRRLRNGSMLFFSKRSTLYHLPWGVVGIISPWNYPFGIPMHEIVPALLAGNTVVFKTAPETLPVGFKIAELFRLAGLPQDVFQHVNTDAALCGDLFLEPGGVNKLFFTGSVPVGRLLMEKAARTLTPVALELGGKDAMIVCADADLERAAAGAVWAGMSNAGQSCAGVERIYVHKEVYAPFLQRLAKKVGALRVGRDTAFNVDVGALCTERQVSTVQRHIREACENGATVAAKAGSAGTDNPHFIPPMVLTHVDHRMALMREETFGPVLGVMPVEDESEAVRLANDSSYALTGSVWSRDLNKAVRLAEQIRAGAVMINDHLLSHGLTETPWGGLGDSGIGRGHGQFAFEAVTAPKVIVSDWFQLARHQPFWMPYDLKTYQGIKGILLALHGQGATRRLTGLWHALALLPKIFTKD